MELKSESAECICYGRVVRWNFMNIEELKKMKEKAKLTNQEIAELSGIPVSTVNKIFSGATQNPRYATLLAIEEVLNVKEKLPFTYDAGLDGNTRLGHHNSLCHVLVSFLIL